MAEETLVAVRSFSITKKWPGGVGRLGRPKGTDTPRTPLRNGQASRQGRASFVPGPRLGSDCPSPRTLMTCPDSQSPLPGERRDPSPNRSRSSQDESVRHQCSERTIRHRILILVRPLMRVAPAATFQPRLLFVRFAVVLRLDAPRLAPELGFAEGLAVPGELRSFCSCSRSRRTALFIFSTSRRASRRSLATSLRRSFLPVRMLPRIAPSSFSVASSAALMRAIARPFCSKRARAAAVTRARAAGFWAAALREDGALRAVVFRALAFLTGGIDAPLTWDCSPLCNRGSRSTRPRALARADRKS